MNSENSNTSNPYRIVLNFRNKMVLHRGDKRIALLYLINYYIWKNGKNIKKLYGNNK